MPQSHPSTGPVRFLSSVRFPARKAEWSARRNFSSVLFPWSHQATGPERPDTSAYFCFGWIIRNVFHILRYPYGARAWPCSTGRRCHCARTAYGKMNIYAVRSPRWFGGTCPALLFRMYCVSTAYQWRMGDAHAAHMAHEWRCHCVW